MDIRYLNTFKAILETGSFRKAAENLNYAQSTITAQIQSLEEELSVKLFEKIGRRMRLTQAGKELTPYIDRILESARQMKGYGKSGPEPAGALRVAMPETILAYQMPQVFKKLKKMAPDVKLFIQSPNCYDIREQVINGAVDIGVSYNIGGYGNAVVAETLRRYEFVLVGSAGLNTAEADFITENQRKELCLLADQSSHYYKNFCGYLKEKNILLESEVNLFSTEAIKRLVKENMGIAYLPRFTVEEELKNKIIRELPTAVRNSQNGMVCVYHKNKWVTPAMNLFIGLLREI